ncbi:Hint domain-containing protein [Anianabacter salinae]|uniref:Hint domain-containing protein n=1 Tax=Anianabacter salinae TaxID=2851023 RepID=UPI00225DDF4F|nr:Hint domain-containing protein [Anianabacter salinae]MBV0911455.1 Hint domain-containing protein [Anianabacter salinae]
MNVDVFHERVSAHGLPVYRASEFSVASGANLGDPIGDASELILDDIYHLRPTARRWRLSVSLTATLNRLVVTEGSEIGRIAADVFIDSCITLMAPDGSTVDALVLVEILRGGDMIAEVYLLPFDELAARTDYTLVHIDNSNPVARFAELACVSFTRGTRITMATGEQRPIEDLRVGDAVLTRDNGVQQIRWVGQRTVRATGAFAPIVIGRGALNNERELTLSPNQRIFVYQREDRLGAGRSEVMVKAELLVNGTTVQRGDGGFVEYFMVLFDSHEIVYAEGIATESLPHDMRTSPALPRDVQDRLGLPRGQSRRERQIAVELGEGTLDSAIAADILKKASTL